MPAPETRPGRGADAVIEDLKVTLSALLTIPASERARHCRRFHNLCVELQQTQNPFPPELATKIESLLWFCERMCHPDFVPSDGQASFLAWPQTMLDAIKTRLHGDDPTPR